MIGAEQPRIESGGAVGFQIRGHLADPRGGGAVDAGQHGPVQHRGEHGAGRGQGHEHDRGRHKGRACRYAPAPRPSSTHRHQSTISAGISPSVPHNVCRARYARGPSVVSASRAAAGAGPQGAQSRADRALGAGGQRSRRDHRVDDDVGRAHRWRPRLRQCDPARGAHPGTDRRPVRAVSAASSRYNSGQGGQALGRTSGDGPLRFRTAVRRQRILRHSRRRSLRIRGRRACWPCG